MSAPFTPGPWHYLDCGEVVPSDEDGFPNSDFRICFLATPGSAINASERIEANGNLITAAPDLYEALVNARAALHQHYVDWDGEPEDVVPLQLARSACDAVLAKARGEA